MEPLRPEADQLLLDFVRSRTFTPRDFLLTDRVNCRLHPQLARAVAGLKRRRRARHDHGRASR